MSEWNDVANKLPDSDRQVIAAMRYSTGKVVLLRAQFVKKFTQTCDEYDGDMDYDENTDNFYLPEGWFELISNWDDYAFIAVCEGEIIAWTEFPVFSYERSEDGTAKM